MTLPVELETSVTQLRAKHTALIDAVNAYRSGTIDASKQELLTLADDIDKQLTVEEHTLLGQVARKGRMPSLLLDFANGKYAVGDRRLERFTSLEDILTFSRSTGGGRTNAQGHYEWVAANEPRIDYDPETGECRGLLFEEQRTNIFTRSESFSAFTRQDVDITTVQAEDLRGEPASVLAIDLDAADEARAAWTLSGLPIGQMYTWSVYVRAFPGESGVWTVVARVPGSDAIAQKFVDDKRWYRISVASLPSSTSTHVIVYPAFRKPGQTLNRAMVTGFQLEEGSFPTSYVPTESSAVTRDRDAAYAYSAPWFSRECTFQVDFSLDGPADTGSHYVLSANDGTAASRYMIGGVSGDFLVRVNLSERDSRRVTVPGLTFGASHRMAVAVDAGGSRLAANGVVTENADTVVMVPSVDRLTLGNTPGVPQGDAQVNGHIKSVTYYPFAMSESELQELTQ